MALTDADFDRWISLSEAADYQNLFFIGTFDPRITFYSQQVRALRLVHALGKRARITAGQAVAVVGGGAAGIAASMAAAVHGCEVKLYEQRTDILQLQSGSPRLLHPHIYEWPARGSLEADAVLPMFDWSEGEGAAVRNRLKTAFDQQRPTNLTVHKSCALESLTRENDEWRLTMVRDDGTPEEKLFSHVFLAMGFGEERIIGAAPSLNYWTDLGPASATAETNTKAYFVSGSGDGGLTDALAVLIGEFDHRRFTGAFLERVGKGKLAEAIEAAENGLALGADLLPALSEHVLPILSSRHAIDFVAGQLRTDRTLTLNAEPILARGRAARLNQVMLLALIEAAKTQAGRLSFSTGEVSDIKKDGDRFRVFGPHADGVPIDKLFDRVIVRHGPDKSARYAKVAQQFQDFRAHHAALLAAAPELTDPPRLAPETFDYFDALLTVRETAPVKKSARLVAAEHRRRSIRLSWDPAFQQLIQQGEDNLENVIASIEAMTDQRTIVLAAGPDKLGEHMEVLMRLRQASGGQLIIAATTEVYAQWSADKGVVSVPAAHLPHSGQDVPSADMLWDGLDTCLLRMLNAAVADAAFGSCAGIGPIHSSIASNLSTTWQSWRSELAAHPKMRSDFLRLLFQVELAGKNRWDGASEHLAGLKSALVLMLATHEGEALLPALCAPGNLFFGGNAVALGSGCEHINDRPIADYSDASQWDVDALILSRGEDGMFQASDLLTDAGEAPTSLTRACRVAPAVITKSLKWRKLLNGDIKIWRDAVNKEFDAWRARQQKQLGGDIVA
ncbi:hypothetical protein ACVIRO_005571 [Rhizobium ruizarguesonis]|nr:hypothetical protein G7039_35515 [Rhizobium leguminosarum]